ncbi:MAG: hypothetical protein ACRECF_06970 [Methyloceanibacter sp.]
MASPVARPSSTPAQPAAMPSPQPGASAHPMLAKLMEMMRMRGAPSGPQTRPTPGMAPPMMGGRPAPFAQLPLGGPVSPLGPRPPMGMNAEMGTMTARPGNPTMTTWPHRQTTDVPKNVQPTQQERMRLMLQHFLHGQGTSGDANFLDQQRGTQPPLYPADRYPGSLRPKLT